MDLREKRFALLFLTTKEMKGSWKLFQEAILALASTKSKRYEESFRFKLVLREKHIGHKGRR